MEVVIEGSGLVILEKGDNYIIEEVSDEDRHGEFW